MLHVMEPQKKGEGRDPIPFFMRSAFPVPRMVLGKLLMRFRGPFRPLFPPLSSYVANNSPSEPSRRKLWPIFFFRSCLFLGIIARSNHKRKPSRNFLRFFAKPSEIPLDPPRLRAKFTGTRTEIREVLFDQHDGYPPPSFPS